MPTKTKKPEPELSPQAKRLMEKLDQQRAEMESVSANLHAVAAQYEANIEKLDAMEAEVIKLHDEDEPFRESIQGSKGTGLQESHFVKTLRQWRKQSVGSLRALASKTGIPFPHLSEVERGQRMLTERERSLLEALIGKKLDVRLMYFITDQDI